MSSSFGGIIYIWNTGIYEDLNIKYTEFLVGARIIIGVIYTLCGKNKLKPRVDTQKAYNDNWK